MATKVVFITSGTTYVIPSDFGTLTSIECIGGGASGAAGSSQTGGAGGSGVLILSYQGTQRGSGGTVTSAGGYTVHTFNSSGTFTA